MSSEKNPVQRSTKRLMGLGSKGSRTMYRKYVEYIAQHGSLAALLSFDRNRGQQQRYIFDILTIDIVI
jgi:hypothetical protein